MKNKNETSPLVNENIRASQVQLITHKGENIGVVLRNEALRMANDAGLDLSPAPKLVKPDQGAGTPEFKSKIAGLKREKSAADRRKANLESKLGINRKDGPTYRKKIGAYVKSSQYRGLSIDQQEEILDQFEDALTAAQLRKARKALNKRKGVKTPTSRPYEYGLNKT